MSTAAKSLLILTLLSGIAAMALPEETLSHISLAACGLFFCSSLVALLAGRKIKFDPVLR
ncbi:MULTISPECIES: PA3371 family protein [unclassified Pseudomonas]|uniref:PA3371 family protein n=1 Tax=unclassified Pseudomonas TaxID=196821 RepID=UPI0008388CF3|nr:MULTISPECIES: PA3371 family protein [unclassified Pseudomonas]QIH10169.1 hypothetical protein ATY02_27315 [Pseudomonas sp. BIOMIG1BAC]